MISTTAKCRHWTLDGFGNVSGIGGMRRDKGKAAKQHDVEKGSVVPGQLLVVRMANLGAAEALQPSCVYRYGVLVP